MRQQRPFRAVTCSDDGTCVFYHGAPYKFNCTLREHSGFVLDAKYSPDGEFFVTAGSDKKLFLYDGKTGALVRQVGATEAAAHAGSIYAVAWSPDSKHIVTSSGDRTCKFWNVAGDRLVGTVVIGDGISAPEHQQVGNVWAGEHIISLSLSGDINVLQMGADRPVRVITGHQKGITAAVLAPSGSPLYTGSYDGKLCAWDLETGYARAVVAAGGSSAKTDAKPEDMAVTASGDVVAMGFIDDTMRFIKEGTVSGAVAAGLGAAPVSLAIDANGTTAVAALADGTVSLVSLQDTHQITKVSKAQAAAQAVAISQATVAIGYADNTVRLYRLAGQSNELVDTGVVVAANTRGITRLAFSRDGLLLACGDEGGKIVVVQASDGSVVTTRWGAHTARIYGLSWSPDNKHAASSSLDGHVIVWSTEDPLSKTIIKNAHLGGSSS
ncbi:WD40 repeat-like protein, partial [Coemansia aciculifera]